MSPQKDLKQAIDAAVYIPDVVVPADYDPVAEEKKGVYMDPRMLAYFYQQLNAERASILEEMGRVRRVFSEAGETRHADQGDRAEQNRVLSLSQASWEHRKALLPKITGLLKDIEEKGTDSDYGYSEISDEPIGAARLKIKPWATKTVDEQGRQEKNNRLYGLDAMGRRL